MSKVLKNLESDAKVAIKKIEKILDTSDVDGFNFTNKEPLSTEDKGLINEIKNENRK